MVQYIKGSSSREIAMRFQSHAALAEACFTGHRLRDEADYRRHVASTDFSPIWARWVTRPEEYPFGSARGKYRLDAWPLTSGAKALTS